MVEEPPESHLLLVSAAELPRGLLRSAAANAEPRDETIGRSTLRTRQDPAPEPRQGEIRRHRLREHEPLTRPILAQEAEALAETTHRRRGTRDRAHSDLPGSHPVEPEDRAHELGATRADEATDPEDLAAPELEARAHRQTQASELIELEHRLARGQHSGIRCSGTLRPPAIHATSSAVRASAMAPVPTTRPSRSTV